MSTIYDIAVDTLDGQPTTLAEHAGEVLLIVNTASKCGLTPQLEGLEALHQRYAERGFGVLGFPCNQFAHQEPGTASEIGAFCQRNYGVTFPMYAKIEVNGPNTHPLFDHLKRMAPGILGSTAVKWNFTKFLVARDGRVVARYAPAVAPSRIAPDVERALAASASLGSYISELGDRPADERTA